MKVALLLARQSVPKMNRQRKQRQNGRQEKEIDVTATMHTMPKALATD